MSKLERLRKIFKFLPKKALVVCGVIAAVAVPLAVGAYGPERPVTAYPTPADHITFNSMTGNPVIGGDERNFVAARVDDGATAADKVWNANSIAVEEGKSYMVQLYVHNNAAANLNLVATNTRAYAAIPTTLAKTATVEGYVSADNSSPKEVWDYVNFTSTRNFQLYIDASYGVHWSNNSIGRTTDAKLDYNGFFTNKGALLGYDKLDGRIPGCFEYAGYVSFKVRPVFEQVSTEFSMSKQVSKHDAKAWGDTYTAQPGELVDFKLGYTNITGETQNDVIFRDVLPAGMTVVSQEFWNNKTGAYQKPISDVTGVGINTGSVAGKGTTGRVNLTVQMPSADKLACGTNTFNNVAFVDINGGAAKEDSATVVIEKNCPKPDPVYTCNALAINKVSRTKFDLTNTYTAQDGAVYKDTTYEITDPDGNKTTKTLSGIYTYENTKVGKYTVVATANFDVDGQEKSVTSAGCQGEFEVSAEPIEPVYTCNAVDIKKVTRTKFELTNTYTAENGAVYKDTTYEVTDPDGVKTSQTLTGTYIYENSKIGKYTVVATSNFTLDGQTVSSTSVNCQGEFTVEEPDPTPDPEYVCNALKVQKTSRTTFQFTTDYTVKDTTYLNITYVITGQNVDDTKVSTASDGGLYYNQNIPGTYTVEATLKTTDGENTSAGCKQTFVVDSEPVSAEAICKVLTANQTVIKKGESVNFRVYPEYHGDVTVNSTWMDFGGGDKTSPLNIVNYTHTYATAGSFTAQAYINFTVEGAAVDNVTSAACQLPILVTNDDPEMCPIPGKENLPIDDPNCKEDPEMCDVPGLENLPKNDPRCKRPEDKCKVPGKEYLPANDPKCVSDTIDHCKIPGKEALPANDPKCVADGGGAIVNPSAPTTLPSTGAEMFGIVGLGSLVTSAGYYITSRRRLGQL
jgi:uncharacterized repeat protein (TIGR01451 family)